MILFPLWSAISNLEEFRRRHNGEGHQITVESRSLLNEKGEPTLITREIHTCICGDSVQKERLGETYYSPR